VDRIARTALMKEALGALARSHNDGDFVVFEDRKTGDYVQFMLVPFLGDVQETNRHSRLPLTANPSVLKAQMEVTARGLQYDGPSPGVPPISPDQDAAFKARGFDFGNYPNYQAVIDLVHLDAIVDECEQLFTILGSAPTFDLGVTTGE
jgi:hypothetical protein